MPTLPAPKLKDLLAGEQIVLAPGVYDGISAQLAQDAGFSAVYMTGAGVSAARGYPDYGLLTMSEMVEAAGVIARTVDIPVISDADTGYGNELNVTRTVREFEQRGVAAIHIEDQVSPKRCGHLAGKELIGQDEYISKIRAAVAARRTNDFLVIARTDAIAVAGFDEAVVRAQAAIAAGADIAFVEAPGSVDELREIPQRIKGLCMVNNVAGGITPILPPEELQVLGFKLAIYPGVCLGPVIQALDTALAKLAGREAPEAVQGPGAFFARFGSGKWDALRMGA